MTNQQNILWRSLLLTILIFSIGILLNHFFDVFRISTITNVMDEHEIDSEAYRVERLFTEVFNEQQCDTMAKRIQHLKEEIRQVGEDLGSYSRFSFFRRKDYDYLKRQYFLLQIRFLATIEKLNKDCGKTYLPILFFYEIDQDESERQGFILQDLSKEYDDQLAVITIDKDYEDEPLVQLLVETYNAQTAPTIVIDDQVYHGLHYTGQLNRSLQNWLRRPDPYSQIDFNYTPRAAGANITQLVSILEQVVHDETADLWARADANLIIGRLTNTSRICKSLQYYDQIQPQAPEEQALLHETNAAIGCGRNRAAFLRAAAQSWRQAGNTFRANLLDKLARGSHIKLHFDEHALTANTTVISGYKTPIKPKLPNRQANSVIIGATRIILDETDNIITQTDRVHRDWLSGQLANPYGPTILTTFSERLTYNTTELRPDIGWHEGGRLIELLPIGINHQPAVGTLVAKKDNRWFAVDHKGIFRFEVPLDKLSYPTTRFLRQDLAVIIDTHGVNMLVEHAIRHHATAVLSDCDHPGKVYAAKHLSDHNISVICYPDKYAYLAIGHNLSLVGSPPQTINKTAIIGGRPITLKPTDVILTVNSTPESYALWYYQTPTSYFTVLDQAAPLNITTHTLTDFNTMNTAIQHARNINATILATRVFNSNDYRAIKNWLDENPEHKAILFHTASYPYGQLLFREYVNQTSFDDPNPIFI